MIKLKIEKFTFLLIFFSLFLFILTFLIHYSNVIKYGYALGWLDTVHHTYAMNLLSKDPMLFFSSTFSFYPLCSTYGNVGAQFSYYILNKNTVCQGSPALYTSIGSPLLYLVGGIFSFFPIKDVNVGYFSSSVLNSFLTVLMFLLIFYFTNDLLISLSSAIILAVNPLSLFILQQGLYTSIIGALLYPFVIFSLYLALKNKEKISIFVTAICILVLAAPFYLLPLTISLFLLIVILFIKDRQLLINFISSFKTIIKNKFCLLLLLIATYYFFRNFLTIKWESRFKEEFNLNYLLNEKSIQIYGVPFQELIELNPMLFLFLFFCSLVIFFKILNLWYKFGIELHEKKVKISLFSSNESTIRMDKMFLPFLFFFGIIISLFLPFAGVILFKKIITDEIITYSLRPIALLPQLFSLSFAVIFFSLKNVLKNKYVISFVVLMFLIYIIFLFYPKLSLLMDRIPLLNNEKYEIMNFLRSKKLNSTLLIFYPNYGFEHFFNQNYVVVSLETFNSVLSSRDISEYVNYSIIILPPVKELVETFEQNNYEIVKINEQVVLMEKSQNIR